MTSQTKPRIPDLDNDGKPFDLDSYFAKLGFSKKEQNSPDKWTKLRTAYRAGAIASRDQSILDIRRADEWMQQTDEPPSVTRKLFGDFWLEGELAILFADTAKGKSILAVQIAESIARGRPIKPFAMTADPQRVLYLDFELTREQLNERYSGTIAGDGQRFRRRRFHHNCIRGALKADQEVPPAFKDIGAFLAHSIRVAIEDIDARILIIDNISWLRTSNTNASAAIELMRELKSLKNRERLSILVLAHTPKRPFARPLTVNDLAGSKMLANFADSIFAIGESIAGSSARYLKQIKPRSTPLIYDASNVAVARIEKPSNFLKFTFDGFGDEREHLIRPYYNVRKEYRSAGEHDLLENGNAHSVFPALQSGGLRRRLIAKCRELHEAGHSQRQIANTLGIGKGTVGRYLSEPLP
ncbi:MAG: AAA family ATPase [Blastocatellia bacterium]